MIGLKTGCQKLLGCALALKNGEISRCSKVFFLWLVFGVQKKTGGVLKTFLKTKLSVVFEKRQRF